MKASAGLVLVACSLLIMGGADALVRNNLLRLARWAGGYQCLWRQDPAEEFKSLIEENFAGQDDAMNDIKGALNHWMREVKMGSSTTSKPLVLVLVGSTGTGKTQTAKFLAQALFEYTHAETEHVYVPEGQLFLDGATYSKDSGMSIKAFRTRVVNHLKRCQGRGMVVLDEFPKARKELLMALRPLVTGSTSLAADDGESPVTGSAHQSVVVLTADLLQDELQALMVAAAADNADGQFEVLVDGKSHPRAPGLSASSISQIKSRLRAAMRQKLAREWQSLGLEASAVIVPFLPFTETAMEQVVGLRMGALERGVASRDVESAVGNITFDRRLVELWASELFVEYSVHVGQGDTAAAIQLSENGARPAMQPTSPTSLALQAVDTLVAGKFGDRSAKLMRSVLRARVEPDPTGNTATAQITVESAQLTADGTQRWATALRSVVSVLE